MSIVFKQERIGYKGKPFYIYKFRTMDKNGKSTVFDNILRRTGLDELPQIWNIMKGDMVLVGPRPITPSDHEKFRRFPLPIKPGLTGWWQIHGRVQALIHKQDVEYFDMQYALGWWIDLYIIIKTIPLVLLGRHG